MPVELQVPVEAADVCCSRVTKLVLHCLVINYVDHWSNDVRSVLGNSAQQRLQPTYSKVTVTCAMTLFGNYFRVLFNM